MILSPSMAAEEAKRWLGLAKDDLHSAEVILNSRQFYVCAFLCQQSVEKGLKALLIKKTGALLKIHDLVLLAKKGGMPEALIEKCDALNNIYLETRYGDVSGIPPSKKFNLENTSPFLTRAKEVIAWLEKNI